MRRRGDIVPSLPSRVASRRLPCRVRVSGDVQGNYVGTMSETPAEDSHYLDGDPAFIGNVGEGKDPSPMSLGTADGGPVSPPCMKGPCIYSEKWKVVSHVIGDLTGDNREGSLNLGVYFYASPCAVVVLSLPWKFRGGWPRAKHAQGCCMMKKEQKEEAPRERRLMFPSLTGLVVSEVFCCYEKSSIFSRGGTVARALFRNGRGVASLAGFVGVAVRGFGTYS